MQVFITGASGFVGTLTTKELISHGYTVLGLARSDASAQKLEKLGAKVLRGTLEDLDVLKKGTAESDAIIHLGFIHDFSSIEAFGRAMDIDQAAAYAMIDALKGTNKVFVGTGGTGMFADNATPSKRSETVYTIAEKAKTGVRTIVVTLPPTTHGPNDPGFLAQIIAGGKKLGNSVYVGEGANKWPTTHVADAAVFFRLCLEKGVAGTIYRVVAEEGIPTKEIAEAVSKASGLPLKSLTPQEAYRDLGFVGVAFGWNNPTSSAEAKAIGWVPKEPTLFEDIQNGVYAKYY